MSKHYSPKPGVDPSVLRLAVCWSVAVVVLAVFVLVVT